MIAKIIDIQPLKVHVRLRFFCLEKYGRRFDQFYQTSSSWFPFRTACCSDPSWLPLIYIWDEYYEFPPWYDRTTYSEEGIAETYTRELSTI